MERNIKHSFETIVETLGRPYQSRTTKEIRLLLEHTAGFLFFKKIAKTNPFSHNLCLQVMRPLAKTKGQLIFLNGEVPDAFYIILKGKVDILVPKPVEQILLEKTLGSSLSSPLSPNPKQRLKKYINILSPFLSPKRKLENQSPYSTKKPILRVYNTKNENIDNTITPYLRSSDIKGNPSDFFEDRIFKYYITRTLEEGMAFGEIPFSNSRTRTYATICSEDSVLGVIEKKDYIQIFKEINRLKIQEKLDFFSRCFFFNSFEKESYKIYNYCFLFKKFKLKKGSLVYEKGEQAVEIFLIKKGEVEIVEPGDGETQLPLKVALLGKGQIIGEEAAEMQGLRRFSTICHSQEVTLFGLNGSLLREIFAGNSEYHEIFKDNVENKMQFRFKKLETMRKNEMKRQIGRRPNEDAGLINQKMFSLRATEEDIDRFIKAPTQMQKEKNYAKTEASEFKDNEANEYKVRVKAFEDRQKKCLFFRGKRLLKKKGDQTQTASFYEIDNSEKKYTDRGDEANYLKEIIRNNRKCYEWLDQRSIKLTREEILQIFDKEKLQIIENRKRLKKKYEEKNKEPVSENKGYYTNLYNEVLESHNKKKNKQRCRSAVNLGRLSQVFEKTNEKGEVRVNFHIRTQSSDPKKTSKPMSGRPVSGGWVIKVDNEKKKCENIYDRIKNQLIIKGKGIQTCIRNADLKSWKKI